MKRPGKEADRRIIKMKRPGKEADRRIIKMKRSGKAADCQGVPKKRDGSCMRDPKNRETEASRKHQIDLWDFGEGNLRQVTNGREFL